MNCDNDKIPLSYYNYITQKQYKVNTFGMRDQDIIHQDLNKFQALTNFEMKTNEAFKILKMNYETVLNILIDILSSTPPPTRPLNSVEKKVKQFQNHNVTRNKHS